MGNHTYWTASVLLALIYNRPQVYTILILNLNL